MQDYTTTTQDPYPSGAVARGRAEPPEQQRAHSGDLSSFEGTPSSNTVPSQYIPDDFVLRFGIDSLYLSYQGDLSEKWQQKLAELKTLAQSDDPRQQAQAQLSIGGHLFEVKDKGQKPFAYVLADNWFRICLSATSARSMPLAYVQISSEVLTLHTLDEIIQDLEFVLNSFAAKRQPATVSRVDLFADFTTRYDLDSLDVKQWVTRTTFFDKHYIRPLFSGWSIGYKGAISARLYDKTLEIKKSLKDYLLPIWLDAGWDGEQRIWRLEFQYKRDVLHELHAFTLTDLVPNQGPLWRYACEQWLRLTIPNDNDSNMSRWPTHPLWQFLSDLDWQDTNTKPLGRVRKDRVPCDESLYVNGIAGLTSFMALNSILDPLEGSKRFLEEARRFHDIRGRYSETSFIKYIQQKVKEKGRRFNTLSNAGSDATTVRDEAKTYQTGRDGE